MRHLSIDILRTVAIFMMVLVHFVENLSANYGQQEAGGHPLTPWWLPTGLAAPLFTLLSGISYAIWVSLQERQGASDDEVNRRTVRRGLFLMMLGFAFNIFVWLPEDTFNWDVLTLVATAMLAYTVVLRLPQPITLGIAVACCVVAPVLREIADYPAYWENYYFDYDVTLSDVVLGYLAVGYFPIFPWLAYPLLGFMIGRQIFTSHQPKLWPHLPGNRKLLIGGSLLMIAAVVASSLALLQAETIDVGFRPPGWTMFPASTTYILGTLAIGLLLLGGLHGLVDTPVTGSERQPPRVKVPSEVTAFFNRVSRHSLSIYLLHHVVHIWPLWIYGWTRSGDPTAHWQTLMPAWASALLGLLFFAACGPLFTWIDRRGLPTAESVMRWVCD